VSRSGRANARIGTPLMRPTISSPTTNAPVRSASWKYCRSAMDKFEPSSA
jgi:hypothetical protein